MAVGLLVIVGIALGVVVVAALAVVAFRDKRGPDDP